MSRQHTRKTTIASNPVSLGGETRGNHSIREYKPTVEDVRKRAHEVYLARLAGGKPGTQESDWLQAERELGIGQKR